jgi:hypothetical protein
MTSYELIALSILGLAPLLIGISYAKAEYNKQAYRLYSKRRNWWVIFTEFLIGWFESFVAEAACILALSIVIGPLYVLIWGL